MSKQKISFAILTLIIGFSVLPTLPVAAESVNNEITVTDDEDPSTGEGEVFYDEEAVTTSETEAQPTQDAAEDCDENVDGDCQTNPERYDTAEELENALNEGLANEPEVICATGDEEGCEDDIDPEMWPLYISLGALGITILIVIIINLVGRKKK